MAETSKNKQLENVTFRQLPCDKTSRETTCGIWKWRPAFLQVCCNLQTFIVVCSIACITQTALAVGYISSQLSTLEKKFGIKISTLGATSNAFEVSYIFLVTFVTYFGAKGRIPLWLANGLVILCLGCVVFALPHFLTESSLVNSKENDFDNKYSLCNATIPNSDSCAETKKNYYISLSCIIIAQILFGAGSSPFLTLGPIYVDDHISSRKASTKIAILHASSATGPVFGFLFGSLMNTFNADMFNSDISYSHLTSQNPNWIGAWWAGFLIIGVICLLTAFMLYLFPTHLPNSRSSSIATTTEMKPLNQDNTNQSEASTPVTKSLANESNNANLQSIQRDNDDSPNVRDEARLSIASTVAMSNFSEFFSMVLTLLKNKIYVITLLAIACELFILVGLGLYVIKYLEEVFHLSNFLASASAGGIMIPFGALGIVVGGLALSKLKLSLKHTLILVIVSSILTVLLMVTLLFIKCEVLVGSTIPYNRVLSGESSSLFQFKSACNANCNCDIDQMHMVHETKKRLLFYSPCFAGCSQLLSHSRYTNCTCLPDSNMVLEEGKLPCMIVILFVTILSLCLFLIGVTQNPLQMIILRTVKHKERPLALGIQFVILRLLSFIPSPNVYGYMMDAACLSRSKQCGRYECLYSNNGQLTSNIISVSISCKILATLLYVTLFILFAKEPVENQKDFFSRNVNNVSLRRSLQMSSKRNSTSN